MVLPEIYTADRTVMPSLGLQYIISNLRGEHSKQREVFNDN